MANPSRKMAVIKRIDGITPIDGADRIELAHIGGWQVVVGKGEYEPNDLCVYYEPDAFLPADDERYADIAKRGVKEMTYQDRRRTGHVLRTARLRGVYSQGLAMRPEDVMPEGIPTYRYAQMCESGTDVSKLVNTWEYVSDIPMTAGFKGKYDNFIATRTDAERSQNVSQETFDLLKRTKYWVSVKVDGTSTTMVMDPRTNEMRYFSHNNEFEISDGIGKAFHDAAERQGLVEWCQQHPGITLQAELCGPKMNANRLGLKERRLFVFSVWDMNAREYVPPFELRDSGAKVVLDNMSPFLGTGYGQYFLTGFEQPEDLLDFADKMRGYVSRGRLDEGLVVHAYEPGELGQDEWVELGNALGPTYQMKAVSRRYLAREK